MKSRDWDNARPIILAGTIVLAFLFLSLALFQIRQVLAVLFVGVILGVTLNPFVDAMARFRMPRIVAILTVYLAVAILLALVTAYGVYEFSRADLAGDIERVRADYDGMSEGTVLPTSDELESSLRSAGQNLLGGLAGQVFTVASVIGGIATILFTAILFSITQNRTREVFLSFVHPTHRERTGEMLWKYARGLRGYARGEIIAMTTIGLITFAGLSLLNVPLAVPLAFIAFLLELLPMIGPWIALIPAVIVGFTQGPWTGLGVLALYLAIQAFESYVLTPMVHSRESEVPAFLIFVSVVIGGALMGVLGALVALPIAIILHITYFELVKPWNRRRFGEPVDVNGAHTEVNAERGEPAEVGS